MRNAILLGERRAVSASATIRGRVAAVGIGESDDDTPGQARLFGFEVRA
jgi:hypothetical protein